MQKAKFSFLVLLAVSFAVFAYAQKNKDDEGVPDNPNHPGSVEIIRESKRVTRLQENVYAMIMEVLNDKEYVDELDYFARKAREHLKLAHDAWLDYQEKELTLETELFGPARQGFPGSDEYHLCDAELTLERISRMRKILEKIHGHEEFLDPQGKLTQKTKTMIETIKRDEASHEKHLKAFSE